MSNLMEEARVELKNIILKSINNAVNKNLLPDLTSLVSMNIEIPAEKSHGDLSTNVAMASAKIFKMSPKNIADIIVNNADISNSKFNKLEVAGPGFINFFFSQSFYAQVLKEIEKQGDNYGKSNYGKSAKVNIEFVSANPTGPMHMGNARGGALGDCLAAVLDAAGFNVCREFYINDAGNQIEKFAHSLDIRYQQIFKGESQVQLPEDCYQGEDIKERAKEFAKINGDKFLEYSEKERRKALVVFALPLNISKMQSDMEKYRIKYDVWFKESILHNDGEILDTINILKEKGLTYELDGALWYKATDFGAEKDEVLIRKNGTPTYFAADIAYHRNKIEKRGFDKCIDIWGADHHGHVSRMKDAMKAIGVDPEKLDIVLMQLVHLVKDGQTVKMSKRTGKAIQLADLLDEVPIDSARFLFNMREPNSKMDFDLDLALAKDSQNPVYYVQYAYARICSIEKSLNEPSNFKRTCNLENLLLLSKPEEIDIISLLALYPDEIILAAKTYDPAKITRYAVNLATLFHKFYNSCKVNCENKSLTNARLCLCLAVKTVIKNILTMFNITTPEKM